MIQQNRSSILALASFGFVTLALGAWALTQETETYLYNAGTALTSINLRPEGAPAGLGISTRRDLLQECDLTLRSEQSIELALQPELDYASLRSKCANIAQSIAQNSPAFSLAWAVAAQAAAQTSDWDGMNEYLKASQLSGPNEQTIGRVRFEVADSHFDNLNADGRSLYDLDLEMLVMSRKGIPYIARQYVLDPQFRSRITKVLETMSPDDQRRYVSTLRRMVSR